MSAPEHAQVYLTSSIYPDPLWSTATVNYVKTIDPHAPPPPDTTNSTLSEHELRLLRRSDSSPYIDARKIRIRNIRGTEDSYNLSEHGLKITHMQTNFTNWLDIEARKREFFPEVAELLKRELGAVFVFSFEHHVRSDSLEGALAKYETGLADIDGPVRRVHIDESPESALKSFRYWCAERPGMEWLRDREVGIYNIWKPLRTVRRDPLCICDVRTVGDADLQMGKVVVPAVGEIENISVRAPEVEGGHGFVYLREQRADEVLLFRITDSRIDDFGNDGVKREGWTGRKSYGAPHTSFVDPGTEGMEPRESVEVRSFCVF